MSHKWLKRFYLVPGLAGRGSLADTPAHVSKRVIAQKAFLPPGDPGFGITCEQTRRLYWREIADMASYNNVKGSSGGTILLDICEHIADLLWLYLLPIGARTDAIPAG